MSDKNTKITPFSKMWSALNKNERIKSVFVLVVVASLLIIVWSFKFGRATVTKATVLTNESESFVIGYDKYVYAVALTEIQTTDKQPMLMSSDQKQIRFKLYAQVSGFCNQTESSYVSLSVKFWIDGDEENAVEKCLPAGSYISVSGIEESYWDQTDVNGFRSDDWAQYIVAPSHFEQPPTTDE